MNFQRKHDNDEFNQVIPREKLAPKKNHVLINDLYKNLGINSIQTVRAIIVIGRILLVLILHCHLRNLLEVSYSGETYKTKSKVC